ncbi:unnamed protein product [Amoebophrya sp. A25]|nr:unnamed protein product [Amoebophrya sp. A25]|eukprot:GSA25T00010084001.1
MTLRTPAIPDDFPHFAAWYGGTPDFQHLVHEKDYSCADSWFKLRQLVDCRYYMKWQYADSKSYTAGAYFNAVEDIGTCRRIASMAPEDRPKAHQEWFLKRNGGNKNTVFDYRKPPRSLGRWDAMPNS